LFSLLDGAKPQITGAPQITADHDEYQ